MEEGSGSNLGIIGDMHLFTHRHYKNSFKSSCGTIVQASPQFGMPSAPKMMGVSVKFLSLAGKCLRNFYRLGVGIDHAPCKTFWWTPRRLARPFHAYSSSLNWRQIIEATFWKQIMVCI